MNYITLENIMESIDPKEIRSIEKGPSKVEAILDKSIAFVAGQKYDEKEALKKSIKKCDDALEDLKEEKLKAINNEDNSRYKFTASYLINIAVTLITSVAAVNGALAVGDPIPMATSVINIVKNGVPDDIKNLTMSCRDYTKLIDHYDDKIRKQKSKLENQLNTLNMEISDSEKKEHGMYKLKEASMPEGDAKISYMSPDELEMKNRAAQVLHDDDDDVEKSAPGNLPVVGDEPEKKPFTPVCNPMDAINKAKCDVCSDPANMMLTKFNGKYYVAYDDLKNYMDSTGKSNYAGAINSIIKAHDSNNDLGCDTLKVIMNSSQLNNCSPMERARMESASVEFEVYD